MTITSVLKQPTALRARATRSLQPLVELIGFGSGLIAIYEFLGFKASVIGVCAVLVYYTVQGYRHFLRVERLGNFLLAELPNHHAFLVEFLRDTYSLPRDEILSTRNEGALITEYSNSFRVSGTNCENHQKIVGKNVGTTPLRGVAFALVGGSSLGAGELRAIYRSSDGPERAPEFIVDRDRFKIAFCEFPQPVPPNKRFEIAYRDSWPASMRRNADGFFFPEAIYFPSGVQRLVMRVAFDFKISSIAVLEADIDRGDVVTCSEQPNPRDAGNGYVSAYECEIDNPKEHTIYVLYYAAGPESTAV